MRSQLRQDDFVGRIGGEEFLILLPGCDAEAGRFVAERVRHCVASQAVEVGTDSIPVTVSVGLAVTDLGGFVSSLLMEAADAALYRAKTNGRNRVEEGLPGSARAA